MRRNKKILSIYRDCVSLNRGTPLRVRSLLSQIDISESFELHTCSKDESVSFGSSHLQITKNNYLSFFRIFKYIRENKIDIIVFHTVSAAYFLLPLTLLKLLNPKLKFVLEMHGFMEEEGRLYGDINGFKYWIYKFWYSRIYFLSDLITTCSETATEILKSYNRNVVTIYGGVDLDKFNPNIKSPTSNSFSSEDFVIGYAGNARKWQGVDFLLESFKKLYDTDKGYKLVLLLSEKIDLPKEEGVSLLDPVHHNRVAAQIANLDVLVIPRPENRVNTISFPSKLMEYLAMGKPVVCSKTSDMHRIIKHGENGLLYEPEDMDGFLDCLRLLKEDNVLRKKISRNAYLTVKNNFTWQHQGSLFFQAVGKL